ncbi:hypothetical protein BLN97_02410 [Bradyrhizobium elkanii]|nr:hypothetical protein BLN97_02410 [Bradyrhizobium elkanii]
MLVADGQSQSDTLSRIFHHGELHLNSRQGKPRFDVTRIILNGYRGTAAARHHAHCTWQIFAKRRQEVEIVSLPHCSGVVLFHRLAKLVLGQQIREERGQHVCRGLRILAKPTIGGAEREAQYRGPRHGAIGRIKAEGVEIAWRTHERSDPES